MPLPHVKIFFAYFLCSTRLRIHRFYIPPLKMNLLRNRRKNSNEDADDPQGSQGHNSVKPVQRSPVSPRGLISPPINKAPCQARSYSLHRITKIPEPGQEEFANLRSDFLRASRVNTSPSSKSVRSERVSATIIVIKQ